MKFSLDSENNEVSYISHMFGITGMTEPSLGISYLAEALHHKAIRNNWLDQDILCLLSCLYGQLGKEKWRKINNKINVNKVMNLEVMRNYCQKRYIQIGKRNILVWGDIYSSEIYS